MALTANLKIEGSNNSYNVLGCDYEVTQAIDATGRPSDRPRGGLIEITMAAPDDSDMIFHEWMRDKYATKEGKISFTVNKNNVDKPKTVSFQDAYCIKLREFFDNNNPLQMLITITVAAGKITFGKNCDLTIIDK